MNQPRSKTKSGLSRRTFIRGTATAIAGFTIVPRHVLGGAGFVPPSEKVNIAIIGCGGQGRTNVRALFEQADAQIIAVADPIESQNLDAFYYKGAAGRLPVKAEIEKHFSAKTPNYKVAAYEDFRHLLEKEKGRRCDSLRHARSSARLREHHRDAPEEACLLRETAHAQRLGGAAGRARRQGNRRRHHRWATRATPAISSARLAKSSGTAPSATCGKSMPGPAPPAGTKISTGRPQDEPTPSGVNWDLWLGPREPRGYSAALNPVRWRDFWDFGTAPIGDFFCHNFDPAMWALNLREPLSIEASAVGPVDKYIAPPAGLYTYHFGPRGNKPAVKFTWYEGGLKPPRPDAMEDGDQFDGNGILFIGDKGALSSPGWGGRPKLLPGSKDKAYQRPAPSLTRSKTLFTVMTE